MIYNFNNSDTIIIVIHEIYGINQHMKDVCDSFNKQGFDVICPNLLNEEIAFEYSQEDIAYRNFINNIGFTNALEIINELLLKVKGKYNKIFIVGYSVGATIAWLCSNKDFINGVVGYYGSRIRDYLDVVPLCPTMLFFPQEEQAFNVSELITSLEAKNIMTCKCNGLHGFSDPYSINYNEKSAQNAYSAMMDFLMNH